MVVHREPHHVERSSEFWHYRNMEANRAQIPAGVKFNIAGENILSAIHLRHDKHHQQHLQEESQKALHLQLPMNNRVVDLQQRHESNTINVLLQVQSLVFNSIFLSSSLLISPVLLNFFLFLDLLLIRLSLRLSKLLKLI